MQRFAGLVSACGNVDPMPSGIRTGPNLCAASGTAIDFDIFALLRLRIRSLRSEPDHLRALISSDRSGNLTDTLRLRTRILGHKFRQL